MTEKEGIDQEIKRLSLRIALARFELWESVLNKIPLGLCSHLCQEIAICQLQKRALENGRFNELPYPIRHLYNNN